MKEFLRKSISATKLTKNEDCQYLQVQLAVGTNSKEALQIIWIKLGDMFISVAEPILKNDRKFLGSGFRLAIVTYI